MKLKIVIVLSVLLLLISCTDRQTKKEIKNHKDAFLFNQYVIENKKSIDSFIDDYVNNLSLEKKIAQLFIENLEGCTSFRSYETYGDVTGIKDDTPLVAGGYLYFGYNIAENRQLQQIFNESVSTYCKKYNLILPYLSVDQEGGYVSRLKKLNDKLPSNQEVAEKYTIKQAYDLYKTQAEQMKEMGFHMNLAPVIEVCTEDNQEFLDGRSFGSLEQVINYGRTCVNAYENNRIATVVKHFPGNTNTDPHTGLPEIRIPKDELENYISSFKEILKYNPTAILMSHARTDAVDSGVPACLSKIWVTDILRNQYKYDGLIFSDDIFMGALADNGYPPEKSVVMAIEAGVDCIMISEKRFSKPAAVLYKKAMADSQFEEKITNAVRRIIRYKIDAGLISINQD